LKLGQYGLAFDPELLCQLVYAGLTCHCTPHSEAARAGPASTSLPHLKPGHFSDFIVCSCRSSYLAGRAGRRPAVGFSEKLPQRAGVGDPGDAQRAPEGATPLRERETGRIGVQMSSTTGPDACRIGFEDSDAVHGLGRDNSQQLGGRGPLPATHTGPDRQKSPVRRIRRTRATYHS
jgi:hypothetical protein